MYDVFITDCGRTTQFEPRALGVQGMNSRTFDNLMSFWRDVEALSPQSIPSPQPSDAREPVYDWSTNNQTPWHGGVELPPFPDAGPWLWRHSLFGMIYKRSSFIELLESRIGKQDNVYEARTNGQACVFALAFDGQGQPLPETLTLSMAAWALGVVRTRGLQALQDPDACDPRGLHAPTLTLNLPESQSGLPGFDRQQRWLREELAYRLERSRSGKAFESQAIADFAELVVDKLKVRRLIDRPVHRFKSTQQRRPQPKAQQRPEKVEDDLINSFFIRDLQRVADAGLTNAGVSLQRFIDPLPASRRVDVRRDLDSALQKLHPKNFPEGCWPAQHPLVWSQQLAINAIWLDRKQGGSMFAVNGPPGTGKTTLLRDLVAAIVVERAKVLAKRGSKLFKGERRLQIGSKSIPYYPLDHALSGFTIVVASSNNGAVDNVSLELPKLDAIAEAFRNEVDVYADLASQLLGDNAWALIAGRLGNRGNRSGFVDKFWWSKADTTYRRVDGMRQRLYACLQDKDRPARAWHAAVLKFNRALEMERDVRDRLSESVELPAQLAAARRELEAVRSAASELKTKRSDLSEQALALTRTLVELSDSKHQLSQQLAQLTACQPGVGAWLSTWGQALRDWQAKTRVIEHELAHVTGRLQVLETQRRALDGTLQHHEERIGQLGVREQTLAIKLSELEKRLAQAQQHYAAYTPDPHINDAERERGSPWAHPEWHSRRIHVFLAAMQLHRAFIEHNARAMGSNLGLAADALSGAIPAAAADARMTAFDSLALACPVVSTTFASVSGLFSERARARIGWLLIDEAGQAVPQAAVGAMWRSLHTVVVGDPLQLEPVVTVPRPIEAALAAHYGVDARYCPSQTSVQMLADAATPLGTFVGTEENALWVGAPLRVHRRCDNPMFSVSNAIAYNGLMVHGKHRKDVDWPNSMWIDVAASSSGNHYIQAEGEALHELLRLLCSEHQLTADQLFLISPFRDVVRVLKEQFVTPYKLDGRRIGTVHTTQGKEADVVILVLGGGSAGARDWAATKPNLLNVAVTRAKERVYVIGDRTDWAQRRFYSELARSMETSPPLGVRRPLDRASATQRSSTGQ